MTKNILLKKLLREGKAECDNLIYQDKDPTHLQNMILQFQGIIEYIKADNSNLEEFFKCIDIITGRYNAPLVISTEEFSDTNKHLRNEDIWLLNADLYDNRAFIITVRRAYDDASKKELSKPDWGDYNNSPNKVHISKGGVVSNKVFNLCRVKTGDYANGRYDPIRSIEIPVSAIHINDGKDVIYAMDYRCPEFKLLESKYEVEIFEDPCDTPLLNIRNYKKL